MSCYAVKYLPLMLIQSMYRHNIFGCQEETINNQDNPQINSPPKMYELLNPPIVQQIQRTTIPNQLFNDKNLTSTNRVDPFLEHIIVWKNNN